MDEMKIVSRFTNGIISKLAKMVIKNKLGYDVDIEFNQIKMTVVDGKTHIHLDVDAELSKEELGKILKSVGI